MTDGAAAPMSKEVPWGDVRMAASGALAEALTFADLRRMAKAKLPKPIFDYVDGGGENELTMDWNRNAFDRIAFRPRTVAAIDGRTQATSFFDRGVSAPFGICPMGGLGTLWPKADIINARIAARAGVPYVLASGAGNSIEEIARAVPEGRRWFQLYVFQDDALNRRLLDRASAAGFEALVVTTDTQINPKRIRDIRNGFNLPMRLTPRNVLEFAVRPGWLWNIGRDPRSALMGNLVPELGDAPTARKGFDFFRANRSRSVGWEDLKRLRDHWRGPMVVKGIVTGEEALRAIQLGADAVVVSNHGGRNLDGTLPTIEALPEVVAAVAGRIPAFIDSGIRRGSDIVKALALGARAAFVGRPIAFALAGAGEAGVEHVMAMLHDEVDRVLGLLGCTRIDQLDQSYVARI